MRYLWKQSGFAVVSEARHGDEVMPVVHAFATSGREARAKEDEMKKYPERLRVNIKVVPAILHFER